MMNKFLVFIDAADDAAWYPVEHLLAMTCASDGAVNLKFKSCINFSLQSLKIFCDFFIFFILVLIFEDNKK